MINFLSSWTEQIIVAVVIASVIEMILPDNKNKKYVKMVIGIYILFNIISPIINEKDLISMDSFNLESYAVADTNTIAQTEDVNQTSMDERLQQLYVEELENNIKVKVQEEGYTVSNCKVDAILSGEEKNQGINKITLAISKRSEKTQNNENTGNKSGIESVNKVEINVGLNKFVNNDNSNEESKITNSEIQNLKNTLCTYYEIDNSKVHISVK